MFQWWWCKPVWDFMLWGNECKVIGSDHYCRYHAKILCTLYRSLYYIYMCVFHVGIMESAFWSNMNSSTRVTRISWKYIPGTGFSQSTFAVHFRQFLYRNLCRTNLRRNIISHPHPETFLDTEVEVYIDNISCFQYFFQQLPVDLT